MAWGREGRGTKTRQNTNYLTANTLRTRAGIPDVERRLDGGIIPGKGRDARKRASSALRQARKSSAKTTPL